VLDRGLTFTLQPHATGPCLLSVVGELDYHTAPRLRQVLNELPCASGVAVVIDLSGLVYCDSTGITVLITAYHRTQAARVPLALAGLDPHIAHAFQITGLDRIFTFYDDTDQAMIALTS
jgi:anti-sigma B factor antagonist